EAAARVLAAWERDDDEFRVDLAARTQESHAFNLLFSLPSVGTLFSSVVSGLFFDPAKAALDPVILPGIAPAGALWTAIGRRAASRFPGRFGNFVVPHKNVTQIEAVWNEAVEQRVTAVRERLRYILTHTGSSALVERDLTRILDAVPSAL